MRTGALSEEVREMARSNAGSNGNGDGEPGALASVITLPEKRSGKGETIALGEAPKRMTEAVIPGRSPLLDLMPLTRVGKPKGFSVCGGEESELLASCPRCKTFETLWFKGDVLTPTRRFTQGHNQRVYHGCGSHEPCRLFPKFVAECSIPAGNESLPPVLDRDIGPGAKTNVCAAH